MSRIDLSSFSNQHRRTEPREIGQHHCWVRRPLQTLGCSDTLHDAPADRPVVRHTGRANLVIGWPMAVQNQQIPIATQAMAITDLR